MQLPDTVPYAALAVTTPDEAAVDDGGGHPWQLLTGDGTGAPTFRARASAAFDLIQRDFAAALGEARRAVHTAPDSVLGWWLLDYYASTQYGGPYLDSVRADRRTRLETLERRAGEAAGALEALSFSSLAQLYGDTVRRRRWEDRFPMATPGFSMQYEQRAEALVARARGQSREALDSLEHLWAVLPAREPRVALVGVRQAIAAGDTTRLRVWAARYSAGVPVAEAHVAELMARNPAVRHLGLARLAALRALPLDTRLRGPRLGDTRARYLRRAQDQDRRLLTAIARARLATGDSAAAVALLDSVARVSGDTALLAQTGRLALALGNTPAATRALAALAEWVGAGREVPESVPAAIASAPTWAIARREARATIDARVRASAVSQVMPTLTAQDAIGRRRTLARDSATVLVYWSASCPYSEALLPQLPVLASRVRTLGGRFQLVANSAPLERHAQLLAQAGLGRERPLFDTNRSIRTGSRRHTGAPR